jgi:hypothetical protein
MRTLAPLGIVAVLITVAGCETKTTSSTKVENVARGGAARSSGDVTTDGRKVSYSVDGSGSLILETNGPTATFAGGKVVVEKSRILLNDKAVASIPDNTKTVEIDCTAGKLTIKADGATVHETALDK